MGVARFNFVPWLWSDVSEIAGAIAVDTPNYLLRRMLAIPRRGSERVPTSHVRVILNIIRATLRRHVLPVLVFDGPPEVLKRAPNPDLIREANGLYERFQRDKDPEDPVLAGRLKESPALYGYFALAHVRDIAAAFGIPTVVAPSEAELLAAALCRAGRVLTVVSNDADALLFGTPHLTRQLALYSGQILRTTLSDTLRVTGLTLCQLRDLAILMGCDFHDGLRGVGPHHGMALLRRHGDLENALRSRGLNAAERKPFLEARRVFDEVDTIDVRGLDIAPRYPLRPRLVRVLTPAIGQSLAEEVADEAVPLWKAFRLQQISLEKWL